MRQSAGSDDRGTLMCYNTHAGRAGQYKKQVVSLRGSMECQGLSKRFLSKKGKLEKTEEPQVSSREI
jgi:hypothetical protein